MRILLANIIRTLCQKLAYSEKSDRLYQLILNKNIRPDSKSGGKTVIDLLTSRMSGWKTMGETRIVSVGEEIKKHLKDEKFDDAKMLYETKIIPFNKKTLGRT